MNKKFLLTTLLLGCMISMTTTGCFQKAEDTSMEMEDGAKMEKEAQPACQIEDQQQEEQKSDQTEMEESEDVLN